jgi:hypothetical protein
MMSINMIIGERPGLDVWNSYVRNLYSTEIYTYRCVHRSPGCERLAYIIMKQELPNLP